MNQRFDNQTVIVTGGGGGIGGATCRRFGSEGARVAVFDLNLEAAEKVAAAIRDAGGVAQAFLCDITDRASVERAPSKPPRPSWDRSTCWSTTPAGTCSSRSPRPSRPSGTSSSRST